MKQTVYVSGAVEDIAEYWQYTNHAEPLDVPSMIKEYRNWGTQFAFAYYDWQAAEDRKWDEKYLAFEPEAHEPDYTSLDYAYDREDRWPEVWWDGGAWTA